MTNLDLISQQRQLSLTSRVIIGGVGGVCALLLKLYAQDALFVGNMVFRTYKGLLSDHETVTMLGYGMIAFLVVVLGCLVGFFVEESNKLKMLAIGMSAPAMFTTYSGGGASVASNASPPAIFRVSDSSFGFGLVTVAHAGGKAVKSRPMLRSRPPIAREPALRNGVDIFFGRQLAQPQMQLQPKPQMQAKPILPLQPMQTELVDKPLLGGAAETVSPEQGYYVVIGSVKGLDDAMRYAEKVDGAVPGFNIVVAEPMPGNNFHAIIAAGSGAPMPLEEAEQFRLEVIASGAGPIDTYIVDSADKKIVGTSGPFE